MAILHKKQGLGKDDNITFLMQKTSKGTKPKTDAEMQGIVDEINRQNKIQEVNTRAVYVKDADSFNPEDGMDATDSMLVIGDGAAQEPFIKKYFGDDTFAINRWGERANAGEVGISDMGSGYGEDFRKGNFGVVDTFNAESTAKQSNGRITPLQMLAYAIRHEDGHMFLDRGLAKDGHIPYGLMESGQASVRNIKEGLNINDLINPLRMGNVNWRASMLARRQYGDPDREAVNNYDKNMYAASLIRKGDLNNPLVKEYKERQNYEKAAKQPRNLWEYKPKEGEPGYEKMQEISDAFLKANPDKPVNPWITQNVYDQYKNLDRIYFVKSKFFPDFFRNYKSKKIKY